MRSRLAITLLFINLLSCNRHQNTSSTASDTSGKTGDTNIYLEADSADFIPCTDEMKKQTAGNKMIAQGGDCYMIQAPEGFAKEDYDKPMRIYVNDSYPDVGSAANKKLQNVLIAEKEPTALELIKKAEKKNATSLGLSSRAKRARCRAAAGIAAAAPSIFVYATAAALTAATAGTAIAAVGVAAGVTEATTAAAVSGTATLVTVAGGMTATVFTGKAIYDAAYKSCMKPH